MKKWILCLWFVVSSSLCISDLELEILATFTSFRDCSFSTQILQFPFTITTPGLYCVGNNVTSFSQNTPAITINVPLNNGAGNVILDLNDQTIQSIGQLIQNGIAIQGQRNVIIRNGTLINFSNGIVINSTQRLVQNLLIENVNVIQNNIGITTNGTVGGFNFMFRNVQTLRNFGNGIILNSTSNCLFEECNSSNNGVNNTSASGFFLINCVAPTFIDCQADNNTFHGFNLQGTQFAQFFRCWASQNSGNGFFLTPNTIINNVVVGNNLNNILNECTAQNNGLNGFFAQGNGQSFYLCNALSNVLNGFILAAGTNHSILNSLSKLNFLAGIQLSIGTSNCQIRQNTIIGNGGGGLVNNGTSTSVYQNFANNNNPDFVGVTNFVTTPSVFLPINFTANIAE